jgi:hypothetical protein
MADLRPQAPIKIVDPTTNSQEAGVDASGNLQVIAGSNTGVDIGDVDVTDVVPGVAATSLGKAIQTAQGTTDTGVGALVVRNDVLADLAGADGDWTPLQVNATGAVYVQEGTAMDVSAATVTVDLGANNDVTTEFATSTAVAAMADADANPTVLPIGAYMMGFNGTTWDRVDTANTGRLQVDVISGGGSESPTTPISATITPASVSAGSSTNFDSADITTKKLWGCDIYMTVAWKAVISTLSGGTPTAVTTIGGRAGEAVSWSAPHRNFAVSGTTVAGFRAAITNLDTSEAADAHVTYHYADD